MEIIKIVQDGIELDVMGSVDASSITQDTDNRLVTDAEKTTWNNKQDKLTPGTNVTIIGTTISATDTTYDDTALKTRITAVENREDKDTTYNVATTSANGLMSSADKTKLNGVEAGAEVNTVTSVNGQTGAVTISNTDYNVATTTTNGLMSSADKVKLNGVEDGSQKNTVTSVQGRTGAVTISKSDVGLGSVNNVAITAAQVTKINELNYTRAMTQAQYDALTTTEKNRTDVWYGIYKG